MLRFYKQLTVGYLLINFDEQQKLSSKHLLSIGAIADKVTASFTLENAVMAVESFRTLICLFSKAKCLNFND